MRGCLMGRDMRCAAFAPGMAFLTLLSGCLIGSQVVPARANVPDVARVRLGHGSIGGFHWAAYAEREKSGNPRRPCITAESGGSRWSSGGATVCGSLEPVPILLGHSSSTGKGQRTVLALAFPLHVRSVRLWLRDRKSRRVRLKTLGAQQTATVGLMRFRYATRAFAGPFCLQRFATYDAFDRVIQISPSMGCP